MIFNVDLLNGSNVSLASITNAEVIKKKGDEVENINSYQYSGCVMTLCTGRSVMVEGAKIRITSARMP